MKASPRGYDKRMTWLSSNWYMWRGAMEQKNVTVRAFISRSVERGKRKDVGTFLHAYLEWERHSTLA